MEYNRTDRSKGVAKEQSTTLKGDHSVQKTPRQPMCHALAKKESPLLGVTLTDLNDFCNLRMQWADWAYGTASRYTSSPSAQCTLCTK